MDQREQKGYFILEDGTKSNDPANAKLFKSSKKGKDEDEEDRILKPQRVNSAYLFFSIEYGQELKA